MWKAIGLLSIFISLNTFSQSVPDPVHAVNRQLWPYHLNSPGEFDFASKMEMLIYINLFNDFKNNLNEDSLKKNYSQDKKVNISSVFVWQSQMKDYFITNFEYLPGGIPHDYIPVEKPVSWSGLIKAARTQENRLPESLTSWYKETKKFYSRYLYEQISQVVKFPGVSSENFKLDPSEINGLEFKEKQYLLTFNDLPFNIETKDNLIPKLNELNIKAIFFIQGSKFNTSITNAASKELYLHLWGNQVGTIGKTDKYIPAFPAWEASYNYTQKLLEGTIPPKNKSSFYRPPSGQRTLESVNYLKKKNVRTMLWNIESGNKEKSLSPDQMSDRVISLMLLWRRGIIKFDQSDKKASEALTNLIKNLDKSEVIWISPSAL